MHTDIFHLKNVSVCTKENLFYLIDLHLTFRNWPAFIFLIIGYSFTSQVLLKHLLAPFPFPLFC